MELTTIKKTKKKLNAAVWFLPHVRFKRQLKDEETILLLRSHPFALILNISLNIIFFLITNFVIFNSDTLFAEFLPPIYILKTKIITSLLTISIFAANIIYSFLHWYFDVFLVTNKRIVDMDYSGFQSSHWSTTTLSKIEDISVTYKGILDALLGIGDLVIQTAGAKSEFEISNIPNPDMVQKIITQLIQNRGDKLMH